MGLSPKKRVSLPDDFVEIVGVYQRASSFWLARYGRALHILRT